MRVTYMMHSCFAITIGKTLMLFDYFDRSKVPEVQYEEQLPDFALYDSIYVFHSHGHREHFCLQSLAWGMEYPQITYFLGKDLKFNEKYLSRNGIDPSIKKRMIRMRTHEVYQTEKITVQALDSTDEGAAFVIDYQGYCIYHAGDLNDWSWEERKGDMKDEAYRVKMSAMYQAYLEPLKDRQIDVAFVVLDGRLGDRYQQGMDYFIHHMNARHIFPMHLWGRYELIDRYRRQLQEVSEEEMAEKIMRITQENQTFDI